MVKFVSDLIVILKGKGTKVEYLHCDNKGEHMSKLRTLCQKEEIKLEYTAKSLTRQNGQVEKKINLIW